MKTEFKPRILLFKGRGLVSWLIRWQTRSEYSHSALMLHDGSIIEAWMTKGVRQHWLNDWCDIDVFDVHGITQEQWQAAIGYARAQIGKPYDWLAIIRFLSRFRQPDDERWFCSELVFKAMEVAGVKLLRNVRAGEVSPGMLARSPHLSDADRA